MPAITIHGLATVIYAVPDIARAKAWYTRAFDIGIDAYKAVIAAYADSKEAAAAKDALKKLGVKLDLPAKK